MNGSALLQNIRSAYTELVAILRTVKLRQSLEFGVARFEADLLALESLRDEAKDPSAETGNEILFGESIDRLLPRLLLEFRKLVLSLQREQLPVPERLLSRIGEMEQEIVHSGPASRTAAEAFLGL